MKDTVKKDTMLSDPDEKQTGPEHSEDNIGILVAEVLDCMDKLTLWEYAATAMAREYEEDVHQFVHDWGEYNIEKKLEEASRPDPDENKWVKWVNDLANE